MSFAMTAAAPCPRRAQGTRTGGPATGLAVAARVILAVGGGYALSAAIVALLAVGLPLAGMARAEAVVLAGILGVLLYLGLLLWAFAERRLGRLALATVPGAAAGFGLAALLARTAPGG
jgi:hypothetical protein